MSSDAQQKQRNADSGCLYIRQKHKAYRAQQCPKACSCQLLARSSSPTWYTLLLQACSHAGEHGGQHGKATSATQTRIA
jgi:hypothetical protein